MRPVIVISAINLRSGGPLSILQDCVSFIQKELILDPGFVLFNMLYRLVYRVNIRKNKYVIVLQNWLRGQFQRLFKINSVVVAYPSIQDVPGKISYKTEGKYKFIFPALPRFLKNIEVIVDAVKIVNKKGVSGFNVTLTVDGTENKYTQHIIQYASGVDNINFTGRVSRGEVFELYRQSNCLIFPSKLETRGLPITEFKQFDKPMLLADLPYAHETIGDYKKVNFFAPGNAQQLAELMCNMMPEQQVFMGNKAVKIESEFTQGWAEQFLLVDNEKG